MKNIKKALLVAACAVLMVGMMASCGSGSSEQKQEAVEPMTLSFAHCDPETRFNHKAIEYFRDQLEELSGGTMTVEIFANGALGDEKANFEAIESGSLDLTMCTNGPVSNYVDTIRIFDFPFLFNSVEHAQKVIHGDIPKQFADDFEKVGVHWLACWENGFRSFGNSRNPVKEPKDMKGLKIRTLQTDTMVAGFEALSVQAIPMAASETYTAAQNGVIDGFDQTTNGVVAFKQYEVMKYWTETQMYYPVAWVCISGKTWDKLTDEQKSWIEQAMEKSTAKESELCMAQDEEALNFLRNEWDGEVIEHDDFDRDAFVEQTKSVYEKYKDWYDPAILKQIQDAGK